MNIVKSLLLFPPCPQLHSEAMHRASPQPDQRCMTLNPKLYKKQSKAKQRGVDYKITSSYVGNQVHMTATLLK